RVMKTRQKDRFGSSSQQPRSNKPSKTNASVPVAERRRWKLGQKEALEVIVHADLNAVQVDRSGRKRRNGREVNLAFQALVEVLGLDRPFRCEHDLDT